MKGKGEKREEETTNQLNIWTPERCLAFGAADIMEPPPVSAGVKLVILCPSSLLICVNDFVDFMRIIKNE